MLHDRRSRRRTLLTPAADPGLGTEAAAHRRQWPTNTRPTSPVPPVAACSPKSGRDESYIFGAPHPLQLAARVLNRLPGRQCRAESCIFGTRCPRRNAVRTLCKTVQCTKAVLSRASSVILLRAGAISPGRGGTLAGKSRVRSVARRLGSRLVERPPSLCTYLRLSRVRQGSDDTLGGAGSVGNRRTWPIRHAEPRRAAAPW